MKDGFLVVARKVGETVYITDENGEQITIRVHEARGTWVKLAIRAPRRLKIHKDESARAPGGPVPAPRVRPSGGEGNGG